MEFIVADLEEAIFCPSQSDKDVKVPVQQHTTMKSPAVNELTAYLETKQPRIFFFYNVICRDITQAGGPYLLCCYNFL